GHDGLFNSLDHALVEYRQCQGAGILDGHVGDLAQRGIAAVIGHHDAVQNARMSTPGTNLGECALQRFQAFLHTLLCVLLDVVDHSFDSSIRVPSAPPRTMFSRAPGLFMLKTRSGILWSRHRQIAVRSITPSLRSSTPS